MSFEPEPPNGQKKNAEGLWTQNSVHMAFQAIHTCIRHIYLISTTLWTAGLVVREATSSLPQRLQLRCFTRSPTKPSRCKASTFRTSPVISWSCVNDLHTYYKDIMFISS